MKGALHLDSAGNNSGTGLPDEFQFNAGELRVKFVLSPSTSASYDKYFALGLTPPFAEFELLVQQDHLPDLNLQSLVDNTLDVKLALFDDFIMSFLLYMWYIMLWKSRVISLCCTITVICWLTEYPDEDWARLSTFVTCLIVLIVNFFENQRLSMTTGGPNAPLTEEGFNRVANWDDPWQMHVFMLRFVALLGGTVRSEHDLHQFVVPMVKDGVPVVSLSTALEALRRQPWCKLEPRKLKERDLVRLHGRRKASVKKIKERVCHGLPKQSVSDRSVRASATREDSSDVEPGLNDQPPSQESLSRSVASDMSASRTTKKTVSAVLLEFEPDDLGLEPESCTRRVPLDGELVYSTTDRSKGDWKMTRVDLTPDDGEDGEHKHGGGSCGPAGSSTSTTKEDSGFRVRRTLPSAKL
ncbi:unnamed protein product [Prorocentrum cordatum]|uniref:Autophagy-related protein 9 n=1 Tax=Prorocentrum cordatum TaxID=2364126 RepID=A0ABN9WPQ1_9DINO|nr:unnamed protein product [Polarella glacialis]